MCDHNSRPPSLRYSPALPTSAGDRSHPSSRDTTPVTPVAVEFPAALRTAKGEDSQLPWFKKPIDVGQATTSLCLNTGVLRPDFDEESFPLFDTSSSARPMSPAAPVALTYRPTSTSPRGNQPSQLTAALSREATDEAKQRHGVMAENLQLPSLHPESSSDMSRFEKRAQPISMKGRQNSELPRNRRESLALAQSVGMGLSWGGVSISSFIRDDMLMSGTSPFMMHQSPSFHSSSYIPKAEANFLSGFTCCGLTIDGMHDLLEHYEENHAHNDNPLSNAIDQPPQPDNRAAVAANTAQIVQQEAQQRAQHGQGSTGPLQMYGGASRPNGFSSTLQTIPDMDTVEDMEMDDVDDMDQSTPPSNGFALPNTAPNTTQTSPSVQFAGIGQPQVPQLSTNLMQGHQGYRNSTPNTPIAGRNSATFQGANISSTLNTNPMQQFQDLQNQYRETPDSSQPGTPAELDEAVLAGLEDFSMQNMNFMSNGLGNNVFGTGDDMIDLCIDEPAKRLFSSPGPGNNQQVVHQRLGSGQYTANSELAKRIREQQMAAGLPDTSSNLLPHEEPKPFRCPVIGCEKAYKNQNGLKYHKTHGHTNQRLHENGDGTFSIVDPDTQAPYPGTMGMEKVKPYKCEVCQKRYKNLNGLKYHKTHAPACNPDLQQQRLQQHQSGQPPLQQQTQSPMSSMLGNPSLGVNMNSFGLGGSGDTGMM